MYKLLIVIILSVVSTQAWPRKAKSVQLKQTSFVGTATNELSSAILQSYLDDEKNIAFSPLGYAAILAILNEGARGETKQQLVSSLHLPQDKTLTRKTFHYIMERLKNTNEYKFNRPELKNYFYIYKNYTVNDDFKKILEEIYLTDVRTVERANPLDDSDTEETAESKPVAVELPEDVKEIIPPKDNEKLISFAVEDKPKIEDIPIEEQYKPAKNIKEKIKLLKSNQKVTGYGTEEEETMIADEARVHPRTQRVLFNKNDVASSISVNSVGKKINSKASDSLMLMFNGMYFRGSFEKPFAKEEQGTFYISNTEKIQVPIMKTKGKYLTGWLPDLDSSAIEIPYDGGRYSLLILLPRSRDGLVRLVADLPSSPLAEIYSNLAQEYVDVSLPTFYVETTTKPVAALAKFGVSSIFTPSANLSGISPDDGLFVQEMVQHVFVRVDNAGTLSSELSATNLVEQLKSATVEEEKVTKFCVEHPFIFFIHDKLDGLVVVAGKIMKPEQESPF